MKTCNYFDISRQKDQHQCNPCLLLLGFCLLFPFVICGSVSLLLFLARRCHICLPCPYLERWFDVICLESQRGFAPVVSFARPSSASCSTFPEPLRWHPLPPLGLQIHRRTSVSSAQQPLPKYHFIALWISTNFAQQLSEWWEQANPNAY